MTDRILPSEHVIEGRVALGIASFLDLAPFDEWAAHEAAQLDLSTWLGALIQAHLDDQPTWPGWINDGVAPTLMEYVDRSTANVAGDVWFLGESGDFRLPFSGAFRLAIARNRLETYQIQFVDAEVGLKGRRNTDRDRNARLDVTHWQFTFDGPRAAPEAL